MRRLIEPSLAQVPSERCSSKCGGSSLIEVMLAVAVLAVTALGLIAGQLWTAREARAMSMREQAAWIADSVAEAMSAPSGNEAALAWWNSRAATVLPRTNDVIDKPEPCGGVSAPVGFSCIALAFVK